MLIEQFLKSDVAKSDLLAALSILNRIQFYPMALELGISRASTNDPTNPVERAAIQRGFIEGYKEALADLFYFHKRYVHVHEQKKILPDFHAIDNLLKSKDITEAEANELRKSVK